MTLDPVQIRVLGALIEKEIATPENYPLSLNALVNACNQRSSRDPVLNLTEEEVRQALRTLEDEDPGGCGTLQPRGKVRASHSHCPEPAPRRDGAALPPLSARPADARRVARACRPPLQLRWPRCGGKHAGTNDRYARSRVWQADERPTAGSNAAAPARIARGALRTSSRRANRHYRARHQFRTASTE